MSVVDGSYNHPMKTEEHASMLLAGGIMGQGYQCGQLWGAALAAGARAYQLHGMDPLAESAAVTASQRLAEAFQSRYRSINCSDVTQLDWKNGQGKQILRFFLRGGPIRCFTMTADYSRVALDHLDFLFADYREEAPEPPVSCTAELARKAGVSEMHAVMAAGLAGGIGLSGGACGALGTAFWLRELTRGGPLQSSQGQAGGGGFDLNSAEGNALIEHYLETTDYEFECARVTGRKFENVADHAGYLRAGGCAHIIEALSEYHRSISS
jgi:hypothetical protein